MTDREKVVARFQIDKEVFDTLPIAEQIAITRAAADSARTMTRRVRLYRKSPWGQGWRVFLRALWTVSLPFYGLGALIGNIINWAASNPVLTAAWAITKALFLSTWRLP